MSHRCTRRCSLIGVVRYDVNRAVHIDVVQASGITRETAVYNCIDRMGAIIPGKFVVVECVSFSLSSAPGSPRQCTLDITFSSSPRNERRSSFACTGIVTLPATDEEIISTISTTLGAYAGVHCFACARVVKYEIRPDGLRTLRVRSS